jgi:hypothetical protein
MKTYGGREVKLYVSLTSKLGVDEWSALRSSRIPPGKEPLILIIKDVVWAPDSVWRGERSYLLA